MDWRVMPHELRHAMRIRARGTIRIYGEPCAIAIRGRVIDLAVGGMFARAELPTGLSELVGKQVRIVIHLDAHPRERLELRGRVIRADAPTKTVAIAFESVGPEFEDRVHDALLADLEHDVVESVILVDHDAARRGTVATAF